MSGKEIGRYYQIPNKSIHTRAVLEKSRSLLLLTGAGLFHVMGSLLLATLRRFRLETTGSDVDPLRFMFVSGETEVSVNQRKRDVR